MNHASNQKDQDDEADEDDQLDDDGKQESGADKSNKQPNRKQPSRKPVEKKDAPSTKMLLRSRGTMETYNDLQFGGPGQANPAAKKSQLFQSFTTSQQKEILKMQQENKMAHKYALTVFKDGLYQEVSPEEFEELKKLCPLVADILENHSLIS